MNWSSLAKATPLLLLLPLSACDDAPAPERPAADAAAMPAPTTSTGSAPHVQAADPVQAGRYLALVGGCNDCHTEGWIQTEGDVPEEQWLTGSRIGWRGPWGTTYAANLRLRVRAMTEDQWVEQIHTRHANPPMPWMNVNQMSDRDARSLYQYISSLGPAGEPVPQLVPPNEEPKTPYISLEPVNMQAMNR